MGFPGQRVSRSLKVKFMLLHMQVQAETLFLGAKRREISHRNECSSAYVFQVVASFELPDMGKEK